MNKLNWKVARTVIKTVTEILRKHRMGLSIKQFFWIFMDGILKAVYLTIWTVHISPLTLP